MSDGWYGSITPMIQKFKLIFKDVDGQERKSNCVAVERTIRGNMYWVRGCRGYTLIGERDVVKKLENYIR